VPEKRPPEGSVTDPPKPAQVDEPDTRATAARPVATRSRPIRPIRPAGVLALASGAGAAALVAAARAAGLMPGPTVLVLTVAVGLAIPSSRLLARRILWHGAVVSGAVPVLWWWDLPLGAVGRSGLVLALGVGGLVAWLVWDGPGGVRGRARLLLPDWKLVDLLPLVAAAATAWFTLAWLRVSSGAQALAALVTGWDHSAHYGMVRALRLFGATSGAVPAPAGERWQFTAYPQGYHALVATVMEAMSGTAPGDQGAELVTYLHATCLTLLGAAVMVAAGLCALPRLRRRPAVATPVVGLAVAALVIGPGGESFGHGFVNFVVAAALTACVPLVVVTMPRVALPVPLAALCALLVAIAHDWALLLVMALPMAAVVLLPLGRARWRADRRTWWIGGAVVAATVAGLFAALRILLVNDVSEVLVMPGGVLGPEMGPLVVMVTGALGLCLWGATRSSTRVTWSAVGPAVGLLAAAWLALLQMRAGGELSYYFWKLMIGVELVSVVVLGVAVARWVRVPRADRSRTALLRTGAASLIVAAGCTQLFEVTDDGSEFFSLPSPKVAHAEAVLAAAAVAQEAGGPTVVLTPQGEHALDPLSAQQWHLALTGRWTAEANALADDVLVNDAGGPQDLLLAAERVLSDPDVQVVAPPETAAVLREQLPTHLAERVLSW
jgi:hypothetical protein